MSAAGAGAGTIGVFSFSTMVDAFGVRKANLLYISSQACAVIVAAIAFSVAVAEGLGSEDDEATSEESGDTDADTDIYGFSDIPMSLVWFMAAIVASRPGLYGFDTG